MYNVNNESQSISVNKIIDGYKYNANLTISKTTPGTSYQYRVSVDLLGQGDEIVKGSIYNYDDITGQQTNIRFNSNLTNEQILEFNAQVKTMQTDLNAYLIDGTPLPVN